MRLTRNTQSPVGAGWGGWRDRGRALRAARAVVLPALLLLLAVAVADGAARDSVRVAPAIAVKLPADIVYRHGAGVDSAVVFSHQTHAALVGNRCTGCHPATFHMLTRGPAPSHREMNAGRSCGVCHDGKQAFGVRDAAACGTCHAGVGGGAVAAAGVPAARKLPAPHAYPRSADSPGRVTFRHESHVRGGACASCHPKPFKMASAAPLPGGGMHAVAACGACHDGKRAFATEDGESCARCHIETGAGR